MQDTTGKNKEQAGMKESAALPHYHGHRQRLRERFRKQGSAGMADYEMVELILFRALPRRDIKPLAKQLLAEFGSLSAILGASEKRLSQVKGLGQSAVLDLKLYHEVAKTVSSQSIRDVNVLDSWSSVLDYCRTAMAHEDKEQFRILFLNKKNHLISDEVQQVGTVDHTPVYPREVAKRSLELSASALILVHNHPSGDPYPSRADIEMTKTIIKVLEPLGIVMHDHIIIGLDGHASLKGMQLI